MAQSDSSVGQFDLAKLTQPAEAVQTYMTAFLDERPLPANLRDAAKYALLGGGKRVRPILTIRCCELVGGAADDAMPPAAAIEMIHAFSLVHDDLPAMDDDDLRRGRPTLHRHTNEAMAILAGDLLTSLAFELVATRVADAGLSRAISGELAAATTDMIAGQVYDTLPDFDASLAPIERLQLIHRNKTGALLRAACRMGAMCGRASEQQLAAVTQYAEAIGLMFQVVDDLLDVTQTTEELGKTACKDVEQGKLTYPAVMGLDGTRAEVRRLHEQGMAALAAFGAEADLLRGLCDYLAVREK